MKRGKIFLVNGVPRTHAPKPAPVPLSSLPSMTIGTIGDPNMFISVSSLDKRRRTVTKRIGAWSDNKKGPSGNNEIKLIDLQTPGNTIKIFYTNEEWVSRGGKIVKNVRIESNGTSITYSNTARVNVGPFRINIFRDGARALNFEIAWNTINNITKLGGAIVIILKRIAASNGKVWNGGSGRFWDGFSKAGSAYGLSRSDFETGIGAQSTSAAEELFLTSDEAEFIGLLADNFTQNENIFNDFPDQGEDGEGNNAPVLEWDDTMPPLLTVLDNDNGLEGAVDEVLNNQISDSSSSSGSSDSSSQSSDSSDSSSQSSDSSDSSSQSSDSSDSSSQSSDSSDSSSQSSDSSDSSSQSSDSSDSSDSSQSDDVSSDSSDVSDVSSDSSQSDVSSDSSDGEDEYYCVV